MVCGEVRRGVEGDVATVEVPGIDVGAVGDPRSWTKRGGKFGRSRGGLEGMEDVCSVMLRLRKSRTNALLLVDELFVCGELGWTAGMPVVKVCEAWSGCSPVISSISRVTSDSTNVLVEHLPITI